MVDVGESGGRHGQVVVGRSRVRVACITEMGNRVYGCGVQGYRVHTIDIPGGYDLEIHETTSLLSHSSLLENFWVLLSRCSVSLSIASRQKRFHARRKSVSIGSNVDDQVRPVTRLDSSRARANFVLQFIRAVPDR